MRTFVITIIVLIALGCATPGAHAGEACDIITSALCYSLPEGPQIGCSLYWYGRIHDGLARSAALTLCKQLCWGGAFKPQVKPACAQSCTDMSEQKDR